MWEPYIKDADGLLRPLWVENALRAKNGDELLARVKTVQVTVSMDTKKSRPINDAERDFLNKYLEEEK